MKIFLIIILAASGWGSQAEYKTELPDMESCNARLKAMRIEQPQASGKNNAVTAIAYCAEALPINTSFR